MRILIAEDDPALAKFVSQGLEAEHYSVDVFSDGEQARAAATEVDYDIIILDLNLPKLDGVSVLHQVRLKKPSLPVLVLTQRTKVEDRVQCLDTGADDYLPKPFEPRELLARLRAILRRSRATAPGEKPLTFGRLEIDTAAHAVRLDGVLCELTGYQFDLLVTLARNAGRVLSRDALLDAVKGEQLESFDRSIDVHVSRIRAAIEDNPKKPRRVITVRGSGYVFAKAQD